MGFDEKTCLAKGVEEIKDVDTRVYRTLQTRIQNANQREQASQTF